MKFGLPQFWSAATLGWTLYEYRDLFDSNGLTTKTLSILKYFTDFILKCRPNSTLLYYEVGEGGIDHGYWGPPELQTGSRPVKSTTTGSDVCGEAAAALALMYLNYGGTYGQQCLDAAVSILDQGLNNLGRSDGGYGKRVARLHGQADRGRVGILVPVVGLPGEAVRAGIP